MSDTESPRDDSVGDDEKKKLSLLRKKRGGNVGYIKQIIAETEDLAMKSKDEDVEIALLANKSILEEKDRLLKRYHNGYIGSR